MGITGVTAPQPGDSDATSSTSPLSGRKGNGAASAAPLSAVDNATDTSPGVSACSRLALITAYCVMLSVTILSTYGVGGDFGPHHSLRKPTPITPERWAFAVWLLILALQGMAVLDQILLASSVGSWKLHIMRTIGVAWPLGWLCEVGNLLASYTHAKAGLWVGLVCLVGATAAFGYALVRVYSLRRRLSLGPPAMHMYYLFFTSTAVNTAWLSFCLADGLLVICQAYGMPLPSLEALAIALLATITCAGVWIVSRKKSTDYGLTLIWVLVAIYDQPHAQHIRAAALLFLAVTGLATIFSVMRRKSACCVRDLPLHVEEHDKLLGAA
eukprot:jgi/Tetstr1/466906/TSEL_011360.t1